MDYRLLDLRAARERDFDTQKIVFLQKQAWSATVCYSGVGRTVRVLVRQWLAARTASIRDDAPFESLLEELATADEWIREYPGLKQSFAVAAFVGERAEYALLSTFEHPTGEERPLSPGLQLYRLRPSQPTVYVSGRVEAVPPPVRRRLETFAATNPDPKKMFAALAHAHRQAAGRSTSINPTCFTAYLNQLKVAGGCLHRAGITDAPAGPSHRVVEFTASRAEPTEEHHRAQLEARPDDPDVHVQYGSFLWSAKQDALNAEVAYRRALELDPNHGYALGNLALLVGARGDRSGAEELYRRAMKNPGMGHENACFNFAKFLVNESNDRNYALEILQQGIWVNSDSARLHLLYAEQLLLAGRVTESLAAFEEARSRGADPARLQSAYACAVHMSGAPLSDCVAAYRSAIELAPADGSLRLNLAQLLFLNGDQEQAHAQLKSALSLGLESSAQLEAQIYLLCHTDRDPHTVAREVKALLQNGARLHWDVDRNIEMLMSRDPRRGALARTFVDVMVTAKNPGQLDRAISQYRSL
jgi:Flp pilus assembly protein TadD